MAFHSGQIENKFTVRFIWLWLLLSYSRTINAILEATVQQALIETTDPYSSQILLETSSTSGADACSNGQQFAAANTPGCEFFIMCDNTSPLANQTYDCLNGAIFNPITATCEHMSKSAYLCPNEASSTSTTDIQPDQIDFVPSFPDGVFTGCSDNAIKGITDRCRNVLKSNSTDAEWMACALLHSPGSPSLIPFGLFPSGQRLDSLLEEIHPSENSAISLFTRCAMPELIAHSCFTFSRRPQLGYFKFQEYTSRLEYQESMSSSYSSSASESVTFFFVKITEGYSESNKKTSSHDAQYGTGAAETRYGQEIGRLTMDTCFSDPSWMKDKNILNEEYLNLWRRISTLSKSELIKSSEFQAIMAAGMYLPTSFNVAAEYRSRKEIKYSHSNHTTSFSNSSGVTGGVGFSLDRELTLTATGMYGVQYSTQTSNSKGHYIERDEEVNYGNCDFDAIRKFDSNSMTALRRCGFDASTSIPTLPQFTNIPNGGLTNVMRIIESMDILINPNFEEAVFNYSYVCTCDARGKSTKYTCYDPYSMIYSQGEYVMICDSEEWHMVNGYPHLLSVEASNERFIYSNSNSDFFNSLSFNEEYYAQIEQFHYVTPGVTYDFCHLNLDSCEMMFDTATGELIELGTYNVVILPACDIARSTGDLTLGVTDEGVLAAFSIHTLEVCSTQALTPSIMVSMANNAFETSQIFVAPGVPNAYGIQVRLGSGYPFYISSQNDFVNFIEKYGLSTTRENIAPVTEIQGYTPATCHYMSPDDPTPLEGYCMVDALGEISYILPIHLYDDMFFMFQDMSGNCWTGIADPTTTIDFNGGTYYGIFNGDITNGNCVSGPSGDISHVTKYAVDFPCTPDAPFPLDTFTECHDASVTLNMHYDCNCEFKCANGIATTSVHNLVDPLSCGCCGMMWDGTFKTYAAQLGKI